MSNLKFSIIIPSFNQGCFIEETLLSIFSQNYDNYEVIVIDGGSDDGTKEILEKYDSRIAYWQSRPDGGQSDAIAIGFGLATGDVISWLNSDDVYTAGALKEVSDAFLRTGADLVYGNKYLIDSVGEIIGERYLTPFLPAMLRDAFLCGGFGIYQPAAFWRRELYDRSGGVDRSLKFCMDNDLFNKFVINGGVFYFLDKMLAGFRVHADSKTSKQQAIAESERELLRIKYVERVGIPVPKLKRLIARTYRVVMLTLSGRLLKVLRMRYVDNLKWVP